jgi:hypothetical protein
MAYFIKMNPRNTGAGNVAYSAGSGRRGEGGGGEVALSANRMEGAADWCQPATQGMSVRQKDAQEPLASDTIVIAGWTK